MSGFVAHDDDPAGFLVQSIEREKAENARLRDHLQAESRGRPPKAIIEALEGSGCSFCAKDDCFVAANGTKFRAVSAFIPGRSMMTRKECLAALLLRGWSEGHSGTVRKDDVVLPMREAFDREFPKTPTEG